MANVRRWFDQGRAEVYGLASAARQLAPPGVFIPGIDSRSPQYRATQWRAGDRPASGILWRKIPAASAKGVLPGGWPDVVVLGMHEIYWRDSDNTYGVPMVHAVAYRLGQTAFMVGDVIQDDLVGPATFEGVDPSIKGVALRTGGEDLYAAIGWRAAGSRHFYGISPDTLEVSEVFPQVELPVRAPGAVLL